MPSEAIDREREFANIAPPSTDGPQCSEVPTGEKPIEKGLERDKKKLRRTVDTKEKTD